MLHHLPISATISRASFHKCQLTLAGLLSRRAHQPCGLSCVLDPVQSPENSLPLLEICHLRCLEKGPHVNEEVREELARISCTAL
jgi:hypothetical protein